MSATGRGKKSGYVRPASDYFSTPKWVTRAILPHLRHRMDVLDPCAGQGAILEVLQPNFDTVRGIELEAKSAEVCIANGFRVVCADALTRSWNDPTTIVQNPPYSLAMEFIQKGLDEMRAGGEMAVLLRLGFLGSEKRAEFLKKNPCDIYILSKRPSFATVVKDGYKCDLDNSVTFVTEGSWPPHCSKCGSLTRFVGKRKTKTDASEYAWFVWRRRGGGTWTILDVEEK